MKLIYEGPKGQRIYHFAGQRGASVVPHEDDPTLYELAAIRLQQPAKGPLGGFSLDYTSMLPKRGLTEDQVQEQLTLMSKDLKVPFTTKEPTNEKDQDS